MESTNSNEAKLLFKRCASAPIYNNLQPSTPIIINNKEMTSSQTTNTSSSRDIQSPTLNIFTPRTRRYSTSFSPLAVNGPRLTPRVSQLRQEECVDVMNTREVTHEREVHTAMQISQSWEDLTLDAESWSVKSDSDFTNPLHVTLPTVGLQNCSSPSPTSRTSMRPLPYGLSPSPTRRTFATRRSMSPIAMRPSSLGPVKRKFDLDDNYANSYSPPPFKKMFSESRGNSPICQSPSLTCPSPDSTEGRTTPKLYLSKLYTNTNSSSSLSSSPSASAPSPSMEIPIDLPCISSSCNSSANDPMQSTTIINKIDNNDKTLCDDKPIDMTLDSFMIPPSTVDNAEMITENENRECVDSTTEDVIKEQLTTKSIDELVESNEPDIILT